MPWLSFLVMRKGKTMDLVEVELSYVSNEKKVNLFNISELKISGNCCFIACVIYSVENKSFLGIPSGTGLGVGNMTTVLLSLMLA